MLNRVNDAVVEMDKKVNLINNNSLSLMPDNHKHNADFMVNGIKHIGSE